MCTDLALSWRPMPPTGERKRSRYASGAANQHVGALTHRCRVSRVRKQLARSGAFDDERSQRREAGPHHRT